MKTNFKKWWLKKKKNFHYRYQKFSVIVKNLPKKFHKTRFIRTSRKTWGALLIPYLILMIFLIVFPILIILFYSLIAPVNSPLIFNFTTNNFTKFFYEGSFMITLLRSLGYAFIATILAIIIAYPVSYLMAFSKSKWISYNIWILITLPIWINMLLKTIGLKTLFTLIAPNLLGTPIAVVIGMIYMFIPFVIIPIYNSLDKMERDLIEASKDLGASCYQTFWKITFRQSFPGIITGAILMLLQSATTLLITKYIGLEKQNLIASVIEGYFLKGFNFGLGAAISIVLSIIILVIVLLLRLLSNKVSGREARI